MKYRILTDDELAYFEEDFKHFLIANGVHAEEWKKINEIDHSQAIKLIELFSDAVLQKVYEKIKYIEHRSKKSCMVFYLKEDEIELISINAQLENVDLSTPESIHEVLISKPEAISMFSSKKSYSKNREEEIHSMLEQGCLHSDEKFWNALQAIIYSSN